MQTATVSSFDGVSLHAEFYPGPLNSPTIIWVHGAFEHCGRYRRPAEHFNALGYACLTFDLRGHGRSGGTRMYIRSVDDYLRDLQAVYRHFAPQMGGKVLLVGHSMGGHVVIRQLEEYPDTIPLAAAVVSSPFLGVAAPIPAWKTVLSKIVVKIYPQLAVPADLDPALISHDEAEVKAYKEDPMVHTKATAGWFEALMESMQTARQKAAGIRTPLHFIVSGADKLVQPQASRELYQLLPAALERSYHEFPGFYHEGLNETPDRRAQFYIKLEEVLAPYR